ncbi:hypothetical protein FRC17_000351 [Serendipita sp. 399]|nr:hypothetical protein FRC17_000351 [Serendipita sp. 399]
MQNSGAFRGTSTFGSQGVSGGLNHRGGFGAPARSLTPLANRAVALRDATLEPNAEDENAPPDPSKGLEDQIPADTWPQSQKVGAFGRESTLSTPARTPIRESQLRLAGAGSTIAGSVLAASTAGTPTGGSRIAFRIDPTMASTFDKKTEPELYELWASK